MKSVAHTVDITGCGKVLRIQLSLMVTNAEGNKLSTQIQIYCVKCKAKTDSREVQGVTMKNGRPATQGICVDCGTKKFRIGATV